MIQIASDVEWYVRVYINLVAPGVSPTFWVQNSNPRKVGAAQAPGSVEIRDPNEPWMWRPAKWKDWFHGKKMSWFSSSSMQNCNLFVHNRLFLWDYTLVMTISYTVKWPWLLVITGYKSDYTFHKWGNFSNCKHNWYNKGPKLSAVQPIVEISWHLWLWLT